MLQENMSRRRLLRMVGVGIGGTLLAACQPEVVKETVVVEKEVEKEVEKVVKETVEVEQEVTRVVEKEVPGEGEIFEIRHHIRAGDIGPLYEKMLERFNREHPDAKAVLEPIPGGGEEYIPKILSMHAAGTIGDSVWNSIGTASLYRWADMDITTPLDDLANATGFDSEAFYPQALEVCHYEGKLFGLPSCAHPGASLIVYNKTLFEEEGVEEPSQDWTLQDLVEIAKHFTRDTNGDGRIDSWGINPSVGDAAVHAVMAYTGHEYHVLNAEGTESRLDDPETQEGLRWLYSLFQEHEVTPTAQAMETGFNQIFMAGRCAMYQTGCWGGPGLTNAMEAKGEYPVVWWVRNFPEGPSGVLPSHMEADAQSVTSQSEHKEAAFELISLFVSQEGAALRGQAYGCAGARPDQYETDILKGNKFALVEGKTDADMYQIYDEALAKAAPFYYPANLRQMEFRTQIYEQGMEALWVGQQEPTDAFFNNLDKQAQSILDKSKAGG